MEKFSNLKYERVDIEEFKSAISDLLRRFNRVEAKEEQLKILSEIENKRIHVLTMSDLCYVRFTLNTKDEFYVAEMDYVDEIMPEIDSIVTDIYKNILKSPYRDYLEIEKGSLYFKKINFFLKTFSEEVKELLKKENKLVSEYGKLLASAAIDYKGEVRNLSQMKPFMVDEDRLVREEASELYYGFMSDNMDEFDRNFDELVKLRAEIADKLGFSSFVELGYYRMERMDYDAEMVSQYRKQVLAEIVPVASKLRKRQQERLGLEKLEYYDINYMFKSGNPKPQGEPDWIVEQGRKMYEELSEDTKTFYNIMTEYELMDLVAKPGKSGGGYCTFLTEFEMPFVFSNFNGTEADITVLTHEMGHAFQSYKSSHISEIELKDPTMESAEIHSMSMEFFTYPWMENFFKADVDKFKFMHISDGVLFIPYGVLVDHFQHYVYENPTDSPEMRRKMWRKLEKMYLPEIEYSGNQYLQNGGFWQKQAHIYEVPFYYIDYTLAQICAYQFYIKDMENHEQAWKDYVNLCSLGGTKPFLELLEVANLKSPFEKGTVGEIMEFVDKQLNLIDDRSF